MVNGLFRRAFVSSGVKAGGGRGGRQIKKAGMLILLFNVVKLGWVLRQTGFGWVCPPSPQIVHPVLGRKIY